MDLKSYENGLPIKTQRLRALESEKDSLVSHLEETQAVIASLRRSTRETQLKIRQLNGEIAVESFKQPVLRLVYDRDRQFQAAQA